MGTVKSALEIALEKADKIGSLSAEEKERMKAEENVTGILRDLYQGRIDANGLWQRLKGVTPPLLKMAQVNIIDTLGLGGIIEDFLLKKQAILAVETLKEKPDTAMIESGLHALQQLKKEFEEMKEQVAEDLKKEVERNPKLRMQPVKMGDGRTVMQVTASVDEAVKTHLDEYLSEHEGRYNEEFLRIIGAVKEAF
jgi:hypothetical protein